MCRADKLLTARLCRPIPILLHRHQASQFQCRVGSAWMPLFMWNDLWGRSPFAVVTDHHEIHYICHLLTLSCAIDVLLTLRLLANTCQARQLEAGCDESRGLPGAAVLTADRPESQQHWPSAVITDTAASVVHLSSFVLNCPVQWAKSQASTL